MTTSRVLLITGVAGYWGRRLAGRLLAEPGLRLLGVDRCPPSPPVAGLDFIQADLRHPQLADLLRLEGVDTVCHLQFEATILSQELVFEQNVMGTIALLAACAAAPVEHLVWRSSTAVYGAHPDNSLYLTEEQPLRPNRQYGYSRDWGEIEQFVANFRQQTPDVGVATLRFAHIVGPTAVTPLTRLLHEHVTPILLGFDPLLQLIHEDDVVEALAVAALARPHGAFNVAADGVLPLSKLLALAGTQALPIPHPLLYRAAPWLTNGLLPLAPDHLRYPCVADASRIRHELNFTPRHDAEAIARQFGAHQSGARQSGARQSGGRRRS